MQLLRILSKHFDTRLVGSKVLVSSTEHGQAGLGYKTPQAVKMIHNDGHKIVSGPETCLHIDGQ